VWSQNIIRFVVWLGVQIIIYISSVIRSYTIIARIWDVIHAVFMKI
jgi:hypothetical protein